MSIKFHVLPLYEFFESIRKSLKMLAGAEMV